MKQRKLSLDKVNVVRLNTSSQIIGGAKYEPTGQGVPHSTHCPDPYNAGGNFNTAKLPKNFTENMQSISTQKSQGSSLECLG